MLLLKVSHVTRFWGMRAESNRISLGCDFRQLGVIRAAGVSNLGVRHLEQLYSAGLKVPIALNQMDLHPFMRRQELVEYCNTKGIIMEVRQINNLSKLQA